MNKIAQDILSRLVQDEEGIQHAEEALLLALIAVVALLTVTQLGTRIDAVFGKVRDALPIA